MKPFVSLSGVLEGSAVLVTGASRGIGAAIAAACVSAGAGVALLARTAPTALAERLRALGGRTIAIGGDVSRSADAERAVDLTAREFGHIDVLVNNAAVHELGPLLTLSEASWDRILNVNLKGPLLMTQFAGRRMAERNQGVIINIGSDLAVRGRAGCAAYTASKGALLQLTRTAAIELGEFGVRVVMLSPAVTRTELSAPALADLQTRQELLAKGALKTFNEPEDVAAAAVFLASPFARTVTGCNWPVDAGVMSK
jgi:NAD(P)-dependent dehydrogenase (short-subunit alcohol dehydrogenase family)